MLLVFQIVTVLLVSVAFGLALAHALELPGKMRLNQEAYLTVQTIYYPGFTIAGVGEAFAVVATLILLLVRPRASLAFWAAVTGFVAVLGMHVVFLAHYPTCEQVLAEEPADERAWSEVLLDANRRATQKENDEHDWMTMRDRWEYSHLLRAVLSGIAL